MSKTPEELQKIAEEYERSITPAIEDADSIFKHERIRSFQYGYCAGYQAAAPQWISVKDRLPKFNEHNYSDDVLMLGKFGMEITHIEKTKRIVRWKGLQEVVETNNGSSIDEYTHWMPLPNPPEKES